MPSRGVVFTAVSSLAYHPSVGPRSTETRTLVYTLATRAPGGRGHMAALEDHLGRPLKDTVGNPIKNGSTVIDLMFGIARGTVRLEKGDGVNVLHCLVRNRSSRQADESGCREPHAQGRRRFPHDFDRDWRRVRVRRCESCTGRQRC